MENDIKITPFSSPLESFAQFSKSRVLEVWDIANNMTKVLFHPST
jgi:hypothetical protein